MVNSGLQAGRCSWSRALPYPAELSLGLVDVTNAGSVLDSFPEDATAIPLSTPNTADGNVLLVFSRPVLFALLAGLVGETPTALPADRDLTELELSLVGFLAREFVPRFVGEIVANGSAAEVEFRPADVTTGGMDRH